MKTTPKIVTLILLFIFQLTACQKKPIIIPPVEVEACRITTMTTSEGSATFTYNSFGNPKYIRMGNPRQGNINRSFLYDKYNRLTDHIGTFDAIPDSIQSFTDLVNSRRYVYFEYWHRYVYADDNPNSLPRGDTIREQGGFNGTFPSTISLTYTEAFTSDAQNRIAAVTHRYGTLETTTNYDYDQNGNLILPNVTYDDKKNYRRTNKVWMLIDRNFSRNNPFIAPTYNNEGLPTVFPDPASSVTFYGDFLPQARRIYTMDYSCSAVQTAE